MTPARDGFDPRSTSQCGPRALSRRINPESCSNFKNQVLFPSWQTRSGMTWIPRNCPYLSSAERKLTLWQWLDVLNYCASVATSPDPEDPDLVSRQVESERDRDRVVDDRLDPYSSRFFPKEARTERLAEIVRQERQVERIIRSRTWGLVEERCGMWCKTGRLLWMSGGGVERAVRGDMMIVFPRHYSLTRSIISNVKSTIRRRVYYAWGWRWHTGVWYQNSTLNSKYCITQDRAGRVRGIGVC